MVFTPRRPPVTLKRAGKLWQEDMVTAMGRLGEILYDVYVTGCGFPHGDRGKDFGLKDFARACVGIMDEAKCIETFDHLFTLAATAGKRRRQKGGAPPIDWAMLVGHTQRLKFVPLVEKHTQEDTYRRLKKEQDGQAGGRGKSPRRGDGAGDGDDDDDDGRPLRGKRAGKAQKAKDGKASAKAASKSNDAANSALAKKALEAGPAAITATAGGGKSAAGATATAANIEKALAELDLGPTGSVEIVNYARGEKEVTAANLFNKGVKLCFPDMPGSDAPCFFFWMGKGGCGPAPGKEVKDFACANCQRSKTLGKKAVRPPKELLEALKAAANEDTASRMK